MVCIWMLLDAVLVDRIFDPRSLVWAARIEKALMLGGALTLVIAFLVFKAPEGHLLVTLAVTGGVLAFFGTAYLMRVMRSLLERATSLQDEMAGVEGAGDLHRVLGDHTSGGGGDLGGLGRQLRCFHTTRRSTFPAYAGAMDSSPLVWHYTDATGLLSIVRSHTLWATSSAFLNDDQEILLGARKLRETVQRQMFDDDLARFVLQRLDAGSDTRPSPGLSPFFILSAAQEPDLLVMWRYYGGRGSPTPSAWTPPPRCPSWPMPGAPASTWTSPRSQRPGRPTRGPVARDQCATARGRRWPTRTPTRRSWPPACCATSPRRWRPCAAGAAARHRRGRRSPHRC